MTNEEVGRIYEHLIANRNSLPIIMDRNDLMRLCDRAIQEFIHDPILIELQAPVMVVGDIHGQFDDLLAYHDFLDQSDASVKALFLGDYVDRGANSVEVITLLLCLRILLPERIILLRGNHECREISEQYGFHTEVMKRYNNDEELWSRINDVFEYMSLAAVVRSSNDNIFCVHGGISPDLDNIMDLNDEQKFSKPIRIDGQGITTDLLWSDPVEDEGWNESPRGVSGVFGPDLLDKFCRENNIKLVSRAHEVASEGYHFPLSDDHRILTIFSAKNYERMNNKACIMLIYLDEEDNLQWICKDRDEC